MSNDLWRWADPSGQQRQVRLEELRAALAEGRIAPNTPVWRSGWQNWKPAHEVPELSSASVGGANGVVLNIPPPPLAMLAVQQEYEQKAGAIAPGLTPVAKKEPEPPPPPPYVPMPAKAGSMNPPPENLKTQIGGSAHVPIAPPPAAPPSPPAAGVPPAAPGSAPSLGSSLPTTIGLPPPPEVVALASASPKLGAAAAPPPPAPRSDPIEELSTSALLDASSSSVGMAGQPFPSNPALDQGGFGGLGGLEPREEDVPGIPRKPGLDVILQDLARMRAGKPPQNKLVIGVLGGVALLFVVLLVAGIVSLVSGSSSDSKKTAASASASPSAPQGSASALATTPAPTETAAKPSGPVLGDCTTAGEARTIAPRAQIASGIEAHALGGALVLGFAPSARDAVATSLDPTTLSPTATARAKPVGGDVRRVTPMLVNGKLAAVADTDRKNDKLTGRRAAGPAGVVDVGVSDGSIAWAPHGRDSIAKLFSLDGDGPVEALRAISLPDGKGVAVTFRRGNSISVGIAKGDGVLEPQGEMSTITGQGQVGSPAIGASGDHVIVAWADRAGSDDDWGIRWTKIKIGSSTQEATPFTIPEGGLGGQAMSPAIASLGGGRFLLAWTEGPVSNHQVRALTFDADGSPSGSPLSISTSGVNAGQPAAVVGPDGRGLVAYLAAKGKSLEVQATPVSCPPL